MTRSLLSPLPLALVCCALLLPPVVATAQDRPSPEAPEPPQPGAREQPQGRSPVGRRGARPVRTGTPTEQLFDAINEGDMDEVRAAVASGADIGARNVLGLTPIDLAIDLGRNDVALYLLSLGRVRERPLGPAVQPEPQRTSRPTAQQQRAERAAIEAALRDRAPSVSGQGIVAVAPLWRGDGGTPNPDIGFLGFDAGRPPGAAPPQRQAAPRPQPAPRAAPAGRAPVARDSLPPG